MAIERIAGLAAPAPPTKTFQHSLLETRLEPSRAASPPGLPVATVAAPGSSPVLEQVVAAQRRLDRVLAEAQSGKSFTPAELLALQANVYRASQELDLAGKVVEKVTSGVKQVLQTQV